MKASVKTALRIAIGAAVALLVVFTFISLWKQSRPKPTIYETVSPQICTIEKKAMSTGNLEPRSRMNLTPNVTGILDELNVKEGDAVRKGDVVARIKIIPDVNLLTDADNLVKRAKIELEQAEREAQRSQTLFDKGVVSRDANEKAQSALQVSKQNLNSALAQVEVLTKGTSSTPGSVSTNIVRSTINGLVLSLPVKKGESVSGSSTYSQGTTVAVIADMDDIIFEGYIDETDVVKLNEGMPVTLYPTAMPEVSIPATLEYIANEGEIRNGAKMFRIRAAASLPEGLRIRSGYSVNAEIVLARAEDALTIDESCIEFEGDAQFVYRLVSSKADGQVWERVPVTTGLSDGKDIAVLSGIGKDDIIRGKQL